MVDYYSAGATAYFFLTGNVPIPTESISDMVYRHVIEGTCDPCHPEFVLLIIGLTTNNVRHRLGNSWENLKSHVAFTSGPEVDKFDWEHLKASNSAKTGPLFNKMSIVDSDCGDRSNLLESRRKLIPRRLFQDSSPEQSPEPSPRQSPPITPSNPIPILAQTPQTGPATPSPSSPIFVERPDSHLSIRSSASPLFDSSSESENDGNDDNDDGLGIGVPVTPNPDNYNSLNSSLGSIPLFPLMSSPSFEGDRPDFQTPSPIYRHFLQFQF